MTSQLEENFPGSVSMALRGVRQILVAGWCPASIDFIRTLHNALQHAQSSVVVTVGLERGSEHIGAAFAAGNTGMDGTLGEMFEAAKTADIVIPYLQRGDSARQNRLVGLLRPKSTLVLTPHSPVVTNLRSDVTTIFLAAPVDLNFAKKKTLFPWATCMEANARATNAIVQDRSGYAYDHLLGLALISGVASVIV